MFILKKLLKNELYGFLSMINIFDTKKGGVKKSPLMGLGMVAFVGLLMFMSGSYSFMLALGLIPLNAMHILPLAMFVAGSLAVFFFCALHSSSTLFKSTDYDLLLSLPISNRTIIMSKLACLYISDLGFSLIFMLPCLGVWWYFVRPDILYIILALACLPFIPIIPIALATAIGTFVAFVAGHSRNKTLVSVVVSMALVFGVIYITQIASVKAASGVNIASYALIMQNNLLGQYPPARLFFEATQGNVASFLGFIALSIVVGVFFTLLTARVFKPVHSKLASVTMKASKAVISFTDSGVFKALVKKEAKRFFASSTYVINSGTGSMLGLGALGYVVLFGRSYLEIVLQTPDLYNMILSLAPLIPAAFVALTCSSAASISMEGASLWATKQLPVSAYSIFMAKISLGLILTVPVSVTIALGEIFLLKIQGISIVTTLAFPIAVCFAVAYTGLILNLTFPNFTWTSETRAVKQSASVAITTVVSLCMIGATYTLVSTIFGAEKADIAYGTLTAIMVIGVLVADQYLRKNSERILLKL